MEAKFGPVEKGIKVIGLNRDEIFQKNSRVHAFWQQKERRKCGRFENRVSWRETKKTQIILATACDKNEQQKDAKNNTEL